MNEFLEEFQQNSLFNKQFVLLTLFKFYNDDITQYKNNFTEEELQYGINKIKLTTMENIDKYHYVPIIDLSNNKIQNLQPLSTLINLKELDLSDNQIVDLRPLSALNNLQVLYLSDNQIIDLQPLQILVNLQILYLPNNRFTDIRPLLTLVNLLELDLFDNFVKDIHMLKMKLQKCYIFYDH